MLNHTQKPSHYINVTCKKKWLSFGLKTTIRFNDYYLDNFSYDMCHCHFSVACHLHLFHGI